MESPQLGHFTIGGAEYAGLLTLDGRRSRLEIYSDSELTLDNIETKNIWGVASDGTRITAINCIPANKGGHYRGEQSRYFLSLFPNYVVLGRPHIIADQKQIISLSFTFSSAGELFYDWGTFGYLPRARMLPFDFRRSMLKAVKRLPKHRRRGSEVDLFYHWHRNPIVKVICDRGSISAFNHTTIHSPSPSGIRVENEVRIAVEFPTAVAFEEALRLVFILQSFFELITQSKQNVEKITLTHKDFVDEEPLDVHRSNHEPEKVEDFDLTDALIGGGLQPQEFEAVLKTWLTDDSDLRDARRRFIGGFRRGYAYDTDRLIGAANAFDLLPDRCFGDRKILAPEMHQFIAELQEKTRAKCDECDAVREHKDHLLNAIGRATGMSLRGKILARYATLPDSLKLQLSGMEEVVRYSVLTRNYFVHGTSLSLSAQETYRQAPFFTDTLEFIFAVSDLQSCGWNVQRWSTEHFHSSRLKWYLRNYSDRYCQLKSAISQSH
jgi:hypothetical protein